MKNKNKAKNSIKDTRELFEYYGISDMLEHKGCAFLYDTKESFENSKKTWND